MGRTCLLFTLFLFSCSTPIADLPSGITEPRLQIEQIHSETDKDQDGRDDFLDLVESARAQIGVVTEYDTSYYSGGYPPTDRGACTDVISRALTEAGYDFKSMIDQDIKTNLNAYGISQQDPNIDFRRVQIVKTYLERHAEKLRLEIKPGDKENLKEWQGGDIVTYAQIPGGLWHVAILSDKRNELGVPLLIHNYGFGVTENDLLTGWPTKITGHYRWNVQ